MTVKDKWFILAVRLCGWILITVGKDKWLRCEVRSLRLGFDDWWKRISDNF